MAGCRYNVSDWWLWNGFPMITGNIFGGMIFTGFMLYWSHNRRVINIRGKRILFVFPTARFGLSVETLHIGLIYFLTQQNDSSFGRNELNVGFSKFT